MAMTTSPLADRSHAAISQISLTAPEKLLDDGRILHFLSKLTGCSAGGRSAFELLFTSAAGAAGTALTASLIAHTSLPGPQKAQLLPTASGTLKGLLSALEASGIEAADAPGPLPALRAPRVITLYKQGGALLSEEEKVRIARHEGDISPADIAASASRLIKNGGRFAVVYPAPRALEMMHAMEDAGIAPKRVRTIHGVAGRAPKHILIDGIKGAASGLHWLEPLVLRDENGEPSAEWHRIYD